MQLILSIVDPGATVTVTYVQGTTTDFLVNFSRPELILTAGAATVTGHTSMSPMPTVIVPNPATMVSVVEETAGNSGTAELHPFDRHDFVGQLRRDLDAGRPDLRRRLFQHEHLLPHLPRSADTVGPLVTDFIDPGTGDRLQNGQTVTDQMQCLVVTFDSDMLTTGPNSVTNPANWSLLMNGTVVANGIKSIYYGMNEAALNPLFASLNAPATNKWQAVIVFNGQDGTSYLQDGQYELVATTALRDKAGNALGLTGFQPNGVTFSRSFNIMLATGGETLVNTGGTTGNQITSPPNSQATASDPNGDYVVAWSSASGQNLTFALSTPSSSGYFGLSFNGTTSSDIYFDPNNLPETAANIQTASLRLKSARPLLTTRWIPMPPRGAWSLTSPSPPRPPF